MGGKIAVEFAARFPELVNRLVLLCPSGLSAEERLPIVDGVRRNDPSSLISSVFQDSSRADPNLLSYYQEKFASRSWRSGLLRTVRGTMEHRVVERLAEVTQPTLLVVGQRDRIVNPEDAISAARRLLNGKLIVLPECGHAPQIEEAETVNRLVISFLLKRQDSTLPPRLQNALMEAVKVGAS
jgi:pimeloyl-ACP methyl ester carboxylesterase